MAINQVENTVNTLKKHPVKTSFSQPSPKFFFSSTPLQPQQGFLARVLSALEKC